MKTEDTEQASIVVTLQFHIRYVFGKHLEQGKSSIMTDEFQGFPESLLRQTFGS
jgi:hypothetical protein